MLTLFNVRKSFGTIVAVDGLSLAVRKGELLGLLAPDAGTITIDGLGNPADPNVRLKIGVAPRSTSAGRGAWISST